MNLINNKEKRKKQQNYLSLLPKLKSYSQNVISTRNSQTINPHHNNIKSKNNNSVNNIIPLSHHQFLIQNKQNKQNDQKSYYHYHEIEPKYKYISRSPNYYKKISRSNNLTYNNMNEMEVYQSIEDYIGESRKNNDKKALISLIHSRLQSFSTGNTKFNTISDNSIKQQYRKKYHHKDSLEKFSKLEIQTKNQHINVKPYYVNRKYPQKASRVQNQTQNNQIKRNTQFIEDNDKIEFYETKYSQFKPNKILAMRSNIKVIKNINQQSKSKMTGQFY